MSWLLTLFNPPIPLARRNGLAFADIEPDLVSRHRARRLLLFMMTNAPSATAECRNATVACARLDKRSSEMHAEDLANHLQDLEYSNGKRCDLAATLIESGPVKALLLLQAAEHRTAAEMWNDAVVQLRGTPNAGDAAAMAHDALGPGFPLDPANGWAMLQSCIDDAKLTLETYRSAAEDDQLPVWMQSLLRERVHVIEHHVEQLVRAGSDGTQRDTSPGFSGDEDPDMLFVGDQDAAALELVIDHEGVAFAEPAPVTWSRPRDAPVA